ncbi:MAG: ATP-binding protein [Elusimicrobiota bacterium]
MNNLTPEEICKKLKPVIGKRADILWKTYLTEDWKGRKELEELLQVLYFKHLQKDVSNEPILLSPPDKESAKGEFPIGNVLYNNKEVCSVGLNESDFVKQIGIFSITGEGKTNLAMILALNLLKKKIPFIIIDWKRSYRNLLSLSDKFPELKDVQIFSVGRMTSPFFWNPFRPPPNVHWKTWLAIITEALERSHLAGMGVADFFMKLYEKKFSEAGFTIGQPDKYPNFYDGLKELEKTHAYARELLWKQSASRVLKSFTFGPHAVCFNVRHPIKLEELLEKPVIFELDQELPKPLRTFFTEIILRWIHLYRLSQMESDKLRHVLFIEEIHNLFPKSKIEKESLSSLENVYREIRGFGQGLVSITQHTSLLPIYILGNCHTQITLGLQHGDDIYASKKSLFLANGQENYLDKLKVGEGILKIKNRIDPCHVKFPLVPITKGLITDEIVKDSMKGYFSSSSPAKRDFSVNKGISTRHDTLPHSSEKSEIPPENRKFMIDVYENPTSNIIERYDRLGLNVREGNKIKNQLIDDGLIHAGKITTGKGMIKALHLTFKATDLLNKAGHNVKYSNESLEHRYWKHKIAEYYRNKGYSIRIEEPVNGNADLLIKKINESIAIEIETESRRAVENILKCLKHGCDTVISIATSQDTESKINEELKKAGLINTKKVIATSVANFV